MDASQPVANSVLTLSLLSELSDISVLALQLNVVWCSRVFWLSFSEIWSEQYDMNVALTQSAINLFPLKKKVNMQRNRTSASASIQGMPARWLEESENNENLSEHPWDWVCGGFSFYLSSIWICEAWNIPNCLIIAAW